MSPVPHIVLTDCCPASLTNSEDPVRDLGNDLVEGTQSQDWTGHHSVRKTIISRGKHSGGFESPPQREQCSDSEFKQEVALLVTDLGMRVVSPLEAQELSETKGDVLHTLIISPQTKELSETQLSHRPLLVLFRVQKTVKEAYELLYSLVASFELKFSHAPDQQMPLAEALRSGIETGASMLTFHHKPEIRLMPELSSVSSTLNSNGSTRSADTQRRMTEDVRRTTYKRLDSLEETIRELENTLIEISGHATREQLYSQTIINSSPVPTTGSPTEAKKPPLPPKPSASSPSSIQVFAYTSCVHSCSEAASSFFLHFFSVDGSWKFTFQLLMSAP